MYCTCMAAKDECQLKLSHKLNEREAQYWLGMEPGQLWVLGFKGVAADDDDDDVYYSKGRRPREDEEGEESYEKRRQWPGGGG